jgi:branched-chain amino acid transport system permease protein
MWDSFGFDFVNYYFIPGLVLGCIYALGAIGVTLTFGILRFANFAHGEVMMTGAFLTWTIMIVLREAGLDLHPLLAAIPALALTIPIAMGIDRAFYRPFRERETIIVVIASFGMMLIVRSIVQVIWGPNQLTFVKGIAKSNEALRDITDSWGIMIKMPDKHLWIIGGTVVIMLVFNYILTRTRIGKAMRAVSDSPDLARTTGIDVEAVIRATWVIGGFCAVAAGVFMAMDTQFIESTMGFKMLLPIFAATILGGIGRPFGAVAGGLIIGLAEELSAYPWIGDAPLISPGYKSGIAFSIMVVMLIVRPSGLFRGRLFT